MHSLFFGYNEKIANRILDFCHREHWRKNHKFTLSKYYLIEKGLVCLLKNNISILVYKRGDIIPYLGKDYTLFVLRSTKAFSIDIDQWQILSNEDSSCYLQKKLNYQLIKLDKILNDLSFLTVKQRLAAFLLELAKKEGWSDGEMVLEQRFSQEEIAYIVGAKTETVAKAFSLLREEKILFTGHRKITLLDRNKLEECLN